MYKYIPKCLCQLAQKTGALLKKILGWDDLFSIVVSLVVRSEWHCPFFCRFLFSSSAEILASFTTENIDVSSAESFNVDTMLSDKSLV